MDGGRRGLTYTCSTHVSSVMLLLITAESIYPRRVPPIRDLCFLASCRTDTVLSPGLPGQNETGHHPLLSSSFPSFDVSMLHSATLPMGQTRPRYYPTLACNSFFWSQRSYIPCPFLLLPQHDYESLDQVNWSDQREASKQ